MSKKTRNEIRSLVNKVKVNHYRGTNEIKRFFNNENMVSSICLWSNRSTQTTIYICVLQGTSTVHTCVCVSGSYFFPLVFIYVCMVYTGDPIHGAGKAIPARCVRNNCMMLLLFCDS
jgi:hypothetical protein